MMVSIIAVMIALCVALSGVALVRYRRKREQLALEARERSAAAFRELERRRMNVFPLQVAKEIIQYVKVIHPDSTRRERRAVLAQYRAMLKNP